MLSSTRAMSRPAIRARKTSVWQNPPTQLRATMSPASKSCRGVATSDFVIQTIRLACPSASLRLRSAHAPAGVCESLIPKETHESALRVKKTGAKMGKPSAQKRERIRSDRPDWSRDKDARRPGDSSGSGQTPPISQPPLSRRTARDRKSKQTRKTAGESPTRVGSCRHRVERRRPSVFLV